MRALSTGVSLVIVFILNDTISKPPAFLHIKDLNLHASPPPAEIFNPWALKIARNGGD
jgi:hypothetical protein